MEFRSACGSRVRAAAEEDALDRRRFLQFSGLAAAGALAAHMPAWADSPASAPPADDLARLIPAEKKLDPAWVRSLFERGEPTVYRGAELDKIGLPIGGICAGQLYLGGDGRLWHWDIFNQFLATSGEHYAQPMTWASPVEQGFCVRIAAGERVQSRTLDRKGFADVRFCGQYPIGRVEYRDTACPIEATFEAYSPFIPLDADNSSLPATILRWKVANVGAAPVEVEWVGWLENAVCLHTGKPGEGQRRNAIVRAPGCTLLNSSADGQLADRPDFGTLSLALLGADAGVRLASISADDLHAMSFATEPQNFQDDDSAAKPLGEKLIGALGRTFKLEPGASHTLDFVLAWHFPNLRLDPVKTSAGRRYATRFTDAAAVVAYVAENFEKLTSQTQAWHDAWYDSTLPYWFLERTFANTSILATSTCHWFSDGRFYGWEGVGSCPGTCTHVWQYAQAVARLFPQLERDLRERTDFGLAFDEQTGMIRFRAESEGLAIDGQAGCILRSYREHQMSADDAFLKRNWPRIQRALQCLIDQDPNADGILEGGQHNTLDTSWYGPVAWLSGLYVAALRAGEAMAREAGDEAFASQARTIAERGSQNLVARLWDGESFINLPDAQRLDAINSGSGCEIDQVLGQSWAWQVGLGRVFPVDETRRALQSLWRYNFALDVGPYREVHKPGRWFAMPGEAGLLMCVFPRSDWDYAKAAGRGPEWAAGYFNECMNGFEYQVAGHMLREGMLLEGLAVTRAVHDRYHAARRNPWNEIECGDHYARSMASYGVFLAACGYEYHGPQGRLAFAPRLTPHEFRAAFTAAEGWGRFSQQRDAKRLAAVVELKWGRLRLRSLALTVTDGHRAETCCVQANWHSVAATHEQHDAQVAVTFAEDLTIEAGERLEVTLA